VKTWGLPTLHLLRMNGGLQVDDNHIEVANVCGLGVQNKVSFHIDYENGCPFLS